MQEHTNKDADFTKARRANPIHIVESGRLGPSSAEALRDVHMSLVRAEQNLYNLVQANQAANGSTFQPPSFAYQGQSAFTPAFAPGFAPGFTPTSTMAGIPGLSYGTPQQSWIAPPGALANWNTPQAALATWGALSGIGAPPIVAAGYGPQAFAATAPFPASATRLPVDIADEGKQFVCKVDLPGLRTDQIELLCLEHTLVIKAYREVDGDAASLVQAERGTAMQQRQIVLPSEILPGSVKATLNDGVLTVVVPKAHPTEGPRLVKIQG